MRSIVSSLLAVVLLSFGAALAEDTWISADIGTTTEGSTTPVVGGLEIAGSGNDIWGGSDSFRLVYQSVSGDFSIKTRLLSVSPTDPWSKAGVMIRQSIAPDSKHAMMVATSGANGFAFQWRSETGGDSSHMAGGATAFPNTWVKLVRLGGIITAYKATDVDGLNFEQVGSPLALNLTDPVLVGLCVTAHNDGQLCTAQFRNVSLEAIPSGSGSGLSGYYYADEAFSVGPVLSRVEPVNMDLGQGAPDVSVPADHFSVLWVGQVEPQFTETYTFTTRTDDGVRLWVNGQLLVDKWQPQAATDWSGSIALEAGRKYDLRMEYVEFTGDALAQLYWSSPSTPKQIIPAAQLYASAGIPAVIATTPTDGGVIDPLAPSVSVTFNKIMDRDSVEAAFSMANLGGNFSWSGSTVTFKPMPPLEEGASFNVTVGTGAKDLDGNALAAPYQFTVNTGAIPGLVGEYFNELDLTARTLVRIDPNIDFSWGGGSPDPLIEPETFSARWTGLIRADFTETFTFTVQVDNGVRVWIGGQKIIDDWRDIPPREVSGTFDMVAGQWYPIVVEHFENWGGASINLYWQSAGLGARQIVPTSALRIPTDTQTPTTPTNLAASLIADRTVILNWTASTDDTIVGRYDVYRDGRFIGWTCEPTYRDTNLTPETPYVYQVQASDVVGKRSALSNPLSVTTTKTPLAGDGTGLLAKLYENMDFSSRVAVRVDPQVAFDWGDGAPEPLVDGDSFSVRWVGQVQPLYSEVYTFYTASDDGIRLWVNGQIVVDDWSDHAESEKSGQIPLKAGELYDIRVDYYENTGKAVAKVLWESPSQPQELVPQSQLYPAKWLGGTEIELLTSVESPVSPAWVEGKCSEDAATIQFSVNGDELVDAVRENPTQWYADTASAQGLPYGIALDAENPTDVSVTVSDNVNTQTYDYSLVWTPTKLNDKSWSSDEIVIRVNDSLLFTVEDTGPGAGKGNKNGIVKIDCDGDGKVDYHGAPDVKVPWKYTAPGYYTVTAWLRGKACGTLTVTVMDANLHAPIACEVGHRREKFIEVTPLDSVGKVSFVGNDPELLGVSVMGPAVDEGIEGMKLYLTAVQRGTPILQARVNGKFGPLVRHQEVDEFTLEIPAAEHLASFAVEGGNLGTAKVVIHPFVPNLEFEAHMFGHRSTFSGGETSIVVSTNDFGREMDDTTWEVYGVYQFEIESPADEDSYCFDVTLYQASSARMSVSGTHPANGGKCVWEFTPIVMPFGTMRDLTVTLTTLAKEPRPHKFSIKPSGGEGSGFHPPIVNNGAQTCEGPAPRDVKLSIDATDKANCLPGSFRLWLDDSPSPFDAVTVVKLTCRVSPSAIAANGTVEARGEEDIWPMGREVVWSIEGEKHGCTIDQDGLVKPEEGQMVSPGDITVRVADRQAPAIIAEATLALVSVDSCWVTPATIPLGAQSKAYAGATTTPYGRTVVYSIIPEDLGCSIDPGTGVLTAGDKAGTITIRATDAEVYEAYAETQLTLAAREWAPSGLVNGVLFGAMRERGVNTSPHNPAGITYKIAAGQHMIFRGDLWDYDVVRNVGQSTWRAGLETTDPHKLVFSSNFGTFDSPNGSSTKEIAGIESNNVHFYAANPLPSNQTLTVSVELVDSAIDPIPSPDTGHRRDNSVSVTWTFVPAQYFPYSLHQVGLNPGWSGGTLVNQYDVLPDPQNVPPGPLPHFENTIVGEQFTNPRPLFQMTDLTNEWRNNHPTLLTPDAVAGEFLKGPGGHGVPDTGNGSFVVDQNDQIGDHNIVSISCSPFTDAARQRKQEVFEWEQIYTCGNRTLGTCKIKLRLTTGQYTEIWKDAP